MNKSAFSDALSSAIASKGSLHQKLSLLTEEENKSFFSDIAQFTDHHSGFFPVTRDAREAIKKARSVSTHIFHARSEVNIYFAMFDAPCNWVFQTSRDDVIFTYETRQLVGTIEFQHKVKFGFMQEQTIWMEFVFTDKFVQLVEQAYDRRFSGEKK